MLAPVTHGYRTRPGWFVDHEGRPTLLRGVNLGGSTKVPYTPDGATHLGVDFDGWRDVSFVGRPAPLDELDRHLDRIAHWGFNVLRFLVTWEAIEHAGTGRARRGVPRLRARVRPPRGGAGPARVRRSAPGHVEPLDRWRRRAVLDARARGDATGAIRRRGGRVAERARLAGQLHDRTGRDDVDALLRRRHLRTDTPPRGAGGAPETGTSRRSARWPSGSRTWTTCSGTTRSTSRTAGTSACGRATSPAAGGSWPATPRVPSRRARSTTSPGRGRWRSGPTAARGARSGCGIATRDGTAGARQSRRTRRRDLARPHGAVRAPVPRRGARPTPGLLRLPRRLTDGARHRVARPRPARVQRTPLVRRHDPDHPRVRPRGVPIDLRRGGVRGRGDRGRAREDARRTATDLARPDGRSTDAHRRVRDPVRDERW